MRAREAYHPSLHLVSPLPDRPRHNVRQPRQHVAADEYHVGEGVGCSARGGAEEGRKDQPAGQTLQSDGRSLLALGTYPSS